MKVSCIGDVVLLLIIYERMYQEGLCLFIWYCISIGKQRAMSLEVTCNFRVLKRVENTEYSQATTVITVTMDGLGQMSWLNACCLSIVYYHYPNMLQCWELKVIWFKVLMNEEKPK